jgi:hypothetical protein
MQPTLPPSPKPTSNLRFVWCQRAIAQKGRSLIIALVLATPMVLPLGLPAQANFRQTLRGIFTGDTGQGAKGNARGASIRDRRCTTAVPTVNSDESGSDLSITSPTNSTEQLILLVPNTGQTLITTTVPEVFVYIPPHTSSAAEPDPSLAPAPATNFDQTKIDLDDIDSVVDEGVQDEVDRAQQAELLLEFQFGDTTQYYSLPDEALIAKIQAPEETAFDIGETTPLEVRLICRQAGLTTLSPTAETEFSYSAESEVFVDVQRIAASRPLLAAIETHEPDDLYQLYLDNGLWFEMVAALAANPQSDEWAALLEELEIPAVAPTPQPLTPITN